VGAPFRARPGITFARSANAACAGNSLFWAGDQHAEWKSLRRVVRAGLSAALSGFPFWGHDIGGYTGNPSPELYIRWMQLGTFSPIMQFHGIPPREPWYFGDEAIRVARWCFAVRDQLQPYLREAARQASEEGTPIWRPLIWEWPDDPQARWCDDQFLLGDEILVAPLVDEFPDREVYLPAGEWRDAWSEATFTGPTNLVVNVPLEWIPVFVRSASPVRLPRPPAPLAAPAKVSLPEQPRFHPSGDETIIVTSERGGAATLHLGSGDGIVVWLNGEKVFEKIVHRTAEPDEDAVPVVLQKGDNTLRVKVIHPPAGIGADGFFLRIEHR
jgi:alpha-D-xyloside xylohydrolase